MDAYWRRHIARSGFHRWLLIMRTRSAISVAPHRGVSKVSVEGNWPKISIATVYAVSEITWLAFCTVFRFRSIERVLYRRTVTTRFSPVIGFERRSLPVGQMARIKVCEQDLQYLRASCACSVRVPGLERTTEAARSTEHDGQKDKSHSAGAARANARGKFLSA